MFDPLNPTPPKKNKKKTNKTLQKISYTLHHLRDFIISKYCIICKMNYFTSSENTSSFLPFHSTREMAYCSLVRSTRNFGFCDPHLQMDTSTMEKIKRRAVPGICINSGGTEMSTLLQTRRSSASSHSKPTVSSLAIMYNISHGFMVVPH